MKRSSIILPTVIPLIFTSMAAFAGDFSVPATERAAQRSELLSYAAQALEDAVAPQSRQREPQMSNLWVFPTHDEDTVFARYTLTLAKTTSTTPSATEHLALVKVRDDGSVNVEELTGERRSAAHWSASIGNGHTSDSNAPNAVATAAAATAATATAAVSTPATATTPATSTAAGEPASPHWTSRIGSGRATEAGEPGAESAPVGEERLSKVADAHWTSKVGTGRASEATEAVASRATSSAAPTVITGVSSVSAF